MDILQREYPTKKVSKLINHIRINENALRVAQIVVLHKEKKNLTSISVSAVHPFWVGFTVLIPILYIALWTYSITGDWATEITEKLKLHLQNPNQMVKPVEIVAPKIPDPVPDKRARTKQVSFAKFGNESKGF